MSEVISDLPVLELKRQIRQQRSSLPVYFNTCANRTIAPEKEVQELGLSVDTSQASEVAGVGKPTPTTGKTVFPCQIRAQMGDKNFGPRAFRL